MGDWTWYGVVCFVSEITSNVSRGLNHPPRGLLERSTSRTMSTVCSISTIHSDPLDGQTGRTSMAMLCQAASNSLCPSRRLDIPALPLHGKSFRNGVKFSVQTTSRGRLPCRRWSFDKEAFEWSPAGSKVITGLVVLVESIKLSDAQNRPDRALLRVIQCAKALSLT